MKTQVVDIDLNNYLIADTFQTICRDQNPSCHLKAMVLNDSCTEQVVLPALLHMCLFIIVLLN